MVKVQWGHIYKVLSMVCGQHQLSEYAVLPLLNLLVEAGTQWFPTGIPEHNFIALLFQCKTKQKPGFFSKSVKSFANEPTIFILILELVY